MSEPGEPPRGDPDRVGDSLRSAVERTLAATAGSAEETRQRARELLDEVARRGELAREELGRRRDAARDDLARRGGDASNRLADAIADLRAASRDDLGLLSERIGGIERRLADLERVLRSEQGERPPEGDKPLGGTAQEGKAKAQIEPEDAGETGADR